MSIPFLMFLHFHLSGINANLSQKLDAKRIVVKEYSSYQFDYFPEAGSAILISGILSSGFAIYHYHRNGPNNPPSFSSVFGELPSGVSISNGPDINYRLLITNNSSNPVYVKVIQ